MLTTLLAQDESLRLKDLASYNILDSTPEHEFDQLAELMTIISGCPIAAISFIGQDRQWFKASIGLPYQEIPRKLAFCAHTILDNNLMIVEDTTEDPRFENNPLVAGHLHLRFYAGTPIISSAGHNIGAICVFHQQPTTLTANQQRALTIIASQVTNLLELRIAHHIHNERITKRIELEKKTIQHTLQQQEKERKAIGTELHESLAQNLTACIIQLSLAQVRKEEGLPYIQTAKAELQKAISDIRRLSKSVNPLSLNAVGFSYLLREAMQDFSASSLIPISLHFTGDENQLQNEQATTLLRITTQYLQALENSRDTQKISITLSIQNEVCLQISHFNTEPVKSPASDILLNTIINRAEAAKGKAEVRSDGMQIRLPLKHLNTADNSDVTTTHATPSTASLSTC